MKIIDVRVTKFSHFTYIARDSAGHAHPGPKAKTTSAVLSIIAEGAEGHCMCPTELVRPFLLEKYIKPVLIGEDLFMREKLWRDLEHFQRGSAGQLSDRTLAIVDIALWDLAGNALKLPVWKLIGGYRDKVPAYASIMCGDELEGGLKTPEDYGRFCEQLKKRGYQAIKLHTWMPPVSFAPSVEMDIKACAAAREAVGPDYPLMLDASHWYTRMEAMQLGKAIEKLGYAWYEEPMDESSMSAYKALADRLDIPVIGPEYAWGKHHTRAEWIRDGACDILRTGVHDVGGITPALKCMHLAESFHMDCEVHGNTAANLVVTAACANTTYYERGLLHPFLNYDEVPEHLTKLQDPMDAEGYVHLSNEPGVGEMLNWDWIKEHEVK
jgi:L-alanine-DL-glutamate epimerase-like enolase superfamily enzyme